MSIMCKLGLHRSATKPVWNSGLYFSRCGECASPIYRTLDGRWRAPARGFRIVWKDRTPDDIDWRAVKTDAQKELIYG